MHGALQSLVKKVDAAHPFTFIDVGAMGGIAAKWDVLEDAMKIIAFEADEREYKKLKNTDRVTYLNYLVYGGKQDLTFYIARKPGDSSLFSPNKSVIAQFPEAERYDTIDKVFVPSAKVCAFDTLVQEGKIKGVDFMKLDTEGCEMSILEGARHLLLPELFGLQVEVEFIQKGENQPVFRHVDELLDREGFQLIDLKRQFWKRRNFTDYVGKGQLTFGDTLYFKKIEVLRDHLALNKNIPGYAVSKVHKAILACLVYRVFDYAAAVADMALEQNYFTRQEHGRAVENIWTYASCGVLPEFPGKGFFYKIFRKAAELTKPFSYRGWSDSDRYIGNIRDI